MEPYIGNSWFVHGLNLVGVVWRRALDESNAEGGAVLIVGASGGYQSPDFGAPFCSISTSIVIVTSSPTTHPPLSILAFHFTPKSCRLILVVAFAATLRLPHGSFTGDVGPSTSSTTFFVTPSIVSPPLTLSFTASPCSTL